jgi:predicted enzyme related to lactoylglutathione lyase
MVLNILTESPFFYADDDPVRFNVLRRNEPAFKKFFEKYFGWRLMSTAKWPD